MNVPNPIIRQIGSTRNYKLMEDWKCLIYRNVYLKIKKGFIYDGASIPKPLWWLLGSPFEYSFAILHDGLYKAKLGSRNNADWGFFRAMKSKKVPMWKRDLIYGGLALFGWATWMSKTEHSVAHAQNFVTLEIIV